jgi:hypothetical protein
VTWAAAGLAYHRLPPPESSLAPTWTVRVPVGLLFGWLTVAAAAGQSEELLDPANSDLDLDPERLAIAGLAAVGTIGSAITLGVDRSLAFPAAVAWGLGGVIVAQIEERPAVALAAGAALAAVGLATVGALLRRWRRSRRVR